MLAGLYRVLITESRLARRIRHRHRYPGLTVDDLAEMRIDGEFAYDPGVSIGRGAIVYVPPAARLALGAGAYVGRYVELSPGGVIKIGARSSIQDRCVLLGTIQVGRYCTFAYGIYMSSGNHHFDRVPTSLIKDQDARAAAEAQSPIVIEDDCWIGNGVFVAAGVRIGKGAVVGANSVVTGDVAPYTVVAGSPTRILRSRFEFRPPKQISCERAEDVPYFYAGFRVAEDERVRDRVHGGLVAEGPFTLALDVLGATRLRLRARRVSGRVHALGCAGVLCTLGESFVDLEFPLPAAAERLEIVPSAGGEVCVERAWVE